MANIIISTVLMFFVMRLRMEPVLRLRAMVSRWAKGTMPLDERIEVKSEDEFGELAHDLNLTLDRIFDILQDLRRTIRSQRDIDSDVGEELDRLSRLAQQLQNEVRKSTKSEDREAVAVLEELGKSIDRVQMLCEKLRDTLRSQELLVKRLE